MPHVKLHLVQPIVACVFWFVFFSAANNSGWKLGSLGCWAKKGYLSMKEANLSIPASNNSRHLHKSESIGKASRSSVFHLGCTGGMWLPGLNSHPHFVYVVVVWCCFFIIRASHSSELLYVCVCVCVSFIWFFSGQYTHWDYQVCIALCTVGGCRMPTAWHQNKEKHWCIRNMQVHGTTQDIKMKGQNSTVAGTWVHQIQSHKIPSISIPVARFHHRFENRRVRRKSVHERVVGASPQAHKFGAEKTVNKVGKYSSFIFMKETLLISVWT